MDPWFDSLTVAAYHFLVLVPIFPIYICFNEGKTPNENIKKDLCVCVCVCLPALVSIFDFEAN